MPTGITQSQLANKLGISQRSVSVAFSGGGRISEKTRRRVLRAAEQMGYRPNHVAAALRRGRTNSVGVVWQFANPWTDDALIAVDLLQRIQERGLTVLQGEHNQSDAALCRQLDVLLERQVELLAVWTTPAQLRSPELLKRFKTVPTVAVTRSLVEDFPGDLVVHDRTQAVREVVDHLVDSGRTRLAMITAMAQESNPSKYHAFVERCRERGLPNHAQSLIDLPYPYRPDLVGESYVQAVREAFPNKVGVDAIFCFNDIGAMYVMRELSQRGVRVPEDVAVVGFNNTQAGRVWSPPIASGDRKPAELAATIDQLLDQRLERPDDPPRRETVHMQFIWRESAGPMRTPR